MKVLITGASGFVGAHLAVGLVDKTEYEIIAVGGKNACAEEVLKTASRVLYLDLSDQSAAHCLISRWKPDVVIHAAALARVLECEQEPTRAEQVNVCATKHLLNACRSLTVKPLFVFVSTDLVFESQKAPSGGFCEDGPPPRPRSVYGRTKLAAESFVAQYHGASLVLRICLTYGRQIGAAAGFLGWIRTSLAAEKPVSLYTDEWRTPLLVDDLVTTAHHVLEYYANCRPNSFALPRLLHVAGAERANRYEIGLTFAEVFGYPKDLVVPSSLNSSHQPIPRAEDVSLCADLLRCTLGIEPHNVRHGMEIVAAQVKF